MKKYIFLGLFLISLMLIFGCETNIRKTGQATGPETCTSSTDCEGGGEPFTRMNCYNGMSLSVPTQCTCESGSCLCKSLSRGTLKETCLSGCDSETGLCIEGTDECSVDSHCDGSYQCDRDNPTKICTFSNTYVGYIYPCTTEKCQDSKCVAINVTEHHQQIEYCPSGCENGECLPCNDFCSGYTRKPYEGDFWCVGKNILIKCGDYDNNGCMEWGEPYDCQTEGKVCAYSNIHHASISCVYDTYESYVPGKTCRDSMYQPYWGAGGYVVDDTGTYYDYCIDDNDAIGYGCMFLEHSQLRMTCYEGCDPETGACREKGPTSYCTAEDIEMYAFDPGQPNGGFDIYSLKFTSGAYARDGCFMRSGYYELMEIYCNPDGTLGVIHVPCPNGCDNGACISVCGDGECTGDETSSSCPDDCTTTCTPTCAGKQCGSDGCGGICGTCASGTICENNQCVSTCTQDCQGKQCGSDDCGGICGTCTSGQSCENNQCVSTCTPNCQGKQCGSDGCGGICGTCASGQSCQNGACTTGDQISVSRHLPPRATVGTPFTVTLDLTVDDSSNPIGVEEKFTGAQCTMQGSSHSPLSAGTPTWFFAHSYPLTFNPRVDSTITYTVVCNNAGTLTWSGQWAVNNGSTTTTGPTTGPSQITIATTPLISLRAPAQNDPVENLIFDEADSSDGDGDGVDTNDLMHCVDVYLVRRGSQPMIPTRSAFRQRLEAQANFETSHLMYCVDAHIAS